MNWEVKGYWFSRLVVSIACAFLVMLVATPQSMSTESCAGYGAATAFVLFCLIPAQIANWALAIICLSLIVTLVIMFPVHAIALILITSCSIGFLSALK